MLKLGSEDLTNHKAALRVRQSMAARFSDIFYLKQFKPKNMGAEVLIFSISNFPKGLTYSALAKTASVGACTYKNTEQ